MTFTKEALTFAKEALTFAKEASIFAEEASIFAEEASIFAKEASIFAKEASIFAKEASIFAEEASIFAKEGSIFPGTSGIRARAPGVSHDLVAGRPSSGASRLLLPQGEGPEGEDSSCYRSSPSQEIIDGHKPFRPYITSRPYTFRVTYGERPREELGLVSRRDGFQRRPET
ncbi:MAG TPA: hypothetical protein VGJ81_14340 [Thermoanaerobaculia bacterium]